MKAFKKIIALVLACLMLTGSFAIGAGAAVGIYVDTIKMSLNRNIAGKSPADFDEFLKIETEGASIDEWDIYPGGMPSAPSVSGIAPASIGSEPDKAIPITEFVEGSTYFVELYIELDDGYAFPEPDIDVFVNNIGVEAYADDFQYAEVYFSFTVKGPSSFFADLLSKIGGLFGNGKIRGIDIDFDNRIAGLTPDDYEDYIKINGRGYDFDTTMFGAVYVYDPVENYELYGDDEFIAGHEYIITVYFVADNGKVFNVEDLKAKVNGKAVDEDDIDYNEADYAQACVNITFTAENQPEGGLVKEREKITNIDIDIREDIAGLTPDDFKKIVKINTDNIDFDMSPICAYTSSSDDPISDNEKFVAGETYLIEVYFYADSGYYFADSDELTATVNGKSGGSNMNPGNTRQAFASAIITVTEQQEGGNGFLQAIRDFFAGIIEAISGIFARKPV